MCVCVWVSLSLSLALSQLSFPANLVRASSSLKDSRTPRLLARLLIAIESWLVGEAPSAQLTLQRLVSRRRRRR